mgnify:CR=1 FL=1
MSLPPPPTPACIDTTTGTHLGHSSAKDKNAGVARGTARADFVLNVLCCSLGGHTTQFVKVALDQVHTQVVCYLRVPRPHQRVRDATENSSAEK